MPAPLHPGEPPLECVSIRLPGTLRQRLERIAQADERSVSWLIRRCLEDYIAAMDLRTNGQSKERRSA